jgi:hypothetical protein
LNVTAVTIIVGAISVITILFIGGLIVVFAQHFVHARVSASHIAWAKRTSLTSVMHIAVKKVQIGISRIGCTAKFGIDATKTYIICWGYHIVYSLPI